LRIIKTITLVRAGYTCIAQGLIDVIFFTVMTAFSTFLLYLCSAGVLS